MKRKARRFRRIPHPPSQGQTRAYRKFAKFGQRLWMEHGALDYKDCIADDLFAVFPDEEGRLMKVPSQLPAMAKLKRGETLVLAFIVFKSRAHHDRVTKQVMADPRMAATDPSAMPVDMARFGYGGFKAFVEGRRRR